MARLLYVVGASGSGKDTLLRWVAEHGGLGERFHRARRVITRPAEHGDEGHEAVDKAGFARIAAAGGFALQWQAHDCAYGIRRSIDERLAADQVVAVCGSRAAIDHTLERYPDARVVVVSADPARVAARLHARGREDAAAIAARQGRAESAALTLRPGWLVVANDGTIEHAGRVLARIAASCRSDGVPACA